ncbi:MAG: DUF3159 domain-containing protein [Actinomycetota bacterium]|nr:DUF3159 domain-containing protein [Actinomycetota bacterium]
MEPAVEEMTPGFPSPSRGHETSPDERTVEAEVRAKIAEALGGPRGAVESALPLVVFTAAYVVNDELRLALTLGGVVAVILYGIRLIQRSSTRFVRNGLAGIVVAAVFALAMGSGEAAFLPGIIQNAAWAVALGASIILGWPLAGFLIGAVLGDSVAWRDNRAIVRLSNQLTLVLLVPMVIRVAVQYPLYVAGEVGWLGVARLALGWPLTGATLAVAGAILVRGRTPLPRQPRAQA